MIHTDDADSARFIRGLEAGDAALVSAAPKGDLHVHGLCGGTRKDYMAWCGQTLPPPPRVFPDFTDFDHYLLVTLARPYSGCEGADLWKFFAFFFRNTLENAIADGVTVIEPSIDSSVVDIFGGDAVLMAEEINRIIAETAAARPSAVLDVRPELGMAKGIPLALLESWVPAALSTGIFKSIDLYGDERVGDDADYVPFYRMARERGLRLKAHAGELRGASSVRRSVELFDLDAVQHGISAAEDPAVMEFLAGRGTVLNVCPTSNVRLGRAPSIASHPVSALSKAGVPVTINTDDRIVFDASLSEEYLSLYREGVFTAEELNGIRLRSLK